MPSFAEATARVVEQKQAGWRSRAHGREWILTFERYAFPRIGKMPFSEVTSVNVIGFLAPIGQPRRGDSLDGAPATAECQECQAVNITV